MQTKIISQSATRPANTDAYTANDVVGSIMEFVGLSKISERGGLIQNAVLVASQNAATKLDADLLLFSESFTVAADNAAFVPTDAQMEKLIGVIGFPVAGGKAGHEGVAGAGNAFHSIANVGLSAPDKVYGVLIARNAYAPISAEKFTVNLSVIQSKVD